MAHQLELQFEDYGWTRLAAEAERLGTTVEELVVFAALYFLAELDRGAVSKQVLEGLRAGSPQLPRLD